jgi:hypothetical protein
MGTVHSHDIHDLLQEWQHYYNWERPHGSLNGKTPIDLYLELSAKVPLCEDLEKKHDMSKERIQEANYHMDLQIRKLKGSV